MILRDGDKDDLKFILSSWLQSYRPKNIKKSIFFENEPDKVISILAQSDIVVACNPDDPGQIYGYLIFKKGENLVLHYCYVKRTFRRYGIFKKMIKFLDPEDLVYATHYTDYFKFLQKSFNLIYNPYLR